MSYPGLTWRRWARIASRSRRLSRLRCTAVPILPPTAKPMRVIAVPFGARERTSDACARERPSRRTRAKSPLRVKRLALGSIDRLDRQLVASLEATRLDDLAPAPRSHAGHETVCALARDALRLPGSFHRSLDTPHYSVLQS